MRVSTPTPAGPDARAMSDPQRRVTPVVRLAPAKLNLTLAIIGRRDDGFHALHSVMVPFGLADRLALAPAFVAGDRLHVTGTWPDLGPPDRRPARPRPARPESRPASDRRGAGRLPREGRRRAAAGARGPPGEADPGRSRPRWREQRRCGGPDRRTGGVGRAGDPVPGGPRDRRREPGLGCAVLPGGRMGARRGTRRARRAAPGAPRPRIRRAARDARSRGVHRGRVRGLRERDPARPRRSACLVAPSRRRAGRRDHACDIRGTRRDPGGGERSRGGDRRGGARVRAVPPRPRAVGGTAGGTVRFGPDRCGSSILRSRPPRRPRPGSARRSRRTTCRSRASDRRS